MNNNESVNQFLVRASERCGLSRDVWVEKRIPNDMSKIVVVPAIADLPTEMLASSLLHRPIFERVLAGRYVVVVTLPGRAFMYPAADEVWSLKGDDVALAFSSMIGFDNEHPRVNFLHQQLNKFFPDVRDSKIFTKYYDRGLTREFLDSFTNPEVELPAIGSLKPELARKVYGLSGRPIFIAPFKSARTMDRSGKEVLQIVPKSFYQGLVEDLIPAGFSPVFWHGVQTYDFSAEMVDRSVSIPDTGLAGVVAAVRASGLCLDVFGNLFAASVLARTPCLMIEQRRRFFDLNLGELIGLICPKSLIRTYFSLPGLLGTDNKELVRAIVNRLGDLRTTEELPPSSHDRWPIDFGSVRRRKALKMGLRFISVPKSED